MWPLAAPPCAFRGPRKDRSGSLRSMSDITVSGAAEEAVSEAEIRSAVRELCARYPDQYWREVDRKEAYPEEFVEALTKAGWLAALIPPEYGGAGLGISQAA